MNEPTVKDLVIARFSTKFNLSELKLQIQKYHERNEKPSGLVISTAFAEHLGIIIEREKRIWKTS